jgi:hypothetical protein
MINKMMEIKIIGYILLMVGTATVGWHSRTLWGVVGAILISIGTSLLYL